MLLELILTRPGRVEVNKRLAMAGPPMFSPSSGARRKLPWWSCARAAGHRESSPARQRSSVLVRTSDSRSQSCRRAQARAHRSSRRPAPSGRVRGRGLGRGHNVSVRAARLVANLGLELLLVHRPEPDRRQLPLAAPAMAVPPADPYRISSHRWRQALELVKDVARDASERAKCECVQSRGEACSAIDHCAAEAPGEPVVVGSRGRGAVSSAMLGSVSSRLDAVSSRPAGLVPRKASLDFGHAVSERRDVLEPCFVEATAFSNG